MADCSAKDGHDHVVNLLLMGDSGVGKSSLLSRFTRGKFRDDPKPTTTNNIASRHVYVDGKVVKAQIVDIAGNRRHGDISAELLSANGAVIVYDVTSLSTFEDAKKWYRELQIANRNIEVIMLVGNKSDLIKDSVTTFTEDGKAFAERESLGFIETSAKDNRNVEKAFVQVVTRIVRKLFKNDSTTDAIHAHASRTISSEARMSRYSGKNEPAHYMVKIESFSLLREARTKSFESDVFEASGYKWKLELYPNGDEENGGNHISMYVAICDVEGLPKGWEVWVDAKFCVYDHIRHNYVTFQDVEGKRTRFYEKKMKWGFSKLISMASFTDAGNGFLFQDSCVFGVEVFAVPKYAAKDQCLSMIKPPAVINTHTWTIENFSAMTKNVLYSDDFKIGKIKWKLKLSPKGIIPKICKNLLICLEVHDSEFLPDGWRVYAKFKFRLKNQIQGSYADQEREGDRWFYNSPHAALGFIINGMLLIDPRNGFLSDDVLIVEAEISYVGLLTSIS